MTQPTIDEIRDQIAEWEGREIPYTLDEAAKLPEGCRGCVTIHVGLSNTVAVIVAGPLTGTRTEAPTELEARFRLRHAAMKAEMGIA